MSRSKFTLLKYLGLDRWSKLTFKGLDHKDYALQKSRILLSFIGIFGIITSLFFAVLDLFFAHYYAILFEVVICLVFLLIYALNERGYYKLALALCVFGVNIILFVFSNLFGRANGVQLQYFPIMVFSYLLLADMEIWKRVFVVVFPFSLLFILEYLDYSFFCTLRVDRGPNELFFFLSLVIAVVAVILVIDTIILMNRSMENFLLKSDKDLRAMTEDILEKNDALEKTNAELDRFVYSTSHDLRSPLKSIQGILDLMESDDSEDRRLEYISMIAGRVERLDHFIQDIIDFSKNARTDNESVKIDFSTLYEEIIEDLRYLPNADKIMYQSDIEKIDFYSDERRMKILLNNLISNALKYHNYDQTNPYIKFSVKKRGDQVALILEDNGQGIADEFHTKLFDMFYRASFQSEGSGLGLYIVKEVVDKLGGTVGFQSQENVGTTFTVLLREQEMEV